MIAIGGKKMVKGNKVAKTAEAGSTFS